MMFNLPSPAPSFAMGLASLPGLTAPPPLLLLEPLLPQPAATNSATATRTANHTRTFMDLPPQFDLRSQRCAPPASPPGPVDPAPRAPPQTSSRGSAVRREVVRPRPRRRRSA